MGASDLIFPASNFGDRALQLRAQFRHFKDREDLPLVDLVADVHVDVPDITGDFCMDIDDLIGLELPGEIERMHNTSLLHCGYSCRGNLCGHSLRAAAPGIARNHTGEERQRQSRRKNQGDSLLHICNAPIRWIDGRSKPS